MKEYDISVIVPVFNVEKYLAECLDSILFNSDDINIQIICINDGSTDGSRKILEYYDKTYQDIMLVHQVNKGQSVARNVGIGKATGNYIVFVDSDDFLEKDTLDKLYHHCIKFNLDILDFNAYSNKDGIKKEYFNLKVETERPISGKLYFENYINMYKRQPFIAPWAHVYKTSFLKKNKLFFVEDRIYEDVLFTADAYIKAKKVMFLDLLAYNYRYSDTSTTRNKTSEKKILDLKYIAKELRKISDQNKINIPMDNFFSGYKNFTIDILLDDTDQKLKRYVRENMFGETQYYFAGLEKKFIYLLTKINYTFFILYCRFIILVKGQNV